jgi:predicted nucleic acid-binding protein
VTTFVDTSALLAFIDAADAHHSAVVAEWQAIDEPLVTHAYVVVELLALVRRRLGAEAAMRVIDDLLPAIDVIAVDRDLHDAALREYRTALPSNVSLVDRTSFAFMRREAITTSLAVDADFATAGFVVRP